MAGPFFETFAIAEILKSYLNAGELDPPLFYYRDREKKEIDLLLLQNGILHPIEIKKTAVPEKNDIKAFSVLDSLPGIRRGPGGVVCLCDRLLPLKGEDMMIPAGYV